MKQLTICFFLIFISNCIFSQSSEDFFELAKKKEAQKDYQYASVLIDKAIQLNDTNSWYWLAKSEIQLHLKEPYLALTYIKKAISIDTTDAEPYNRAGSFFESSDLIDSAIYMYNIAIKFAKKDTIRYSYINNRANARTAIRDFEGARVDLESALSFDPNNIGVLNNIANVYAELGENKAAIHTLERLISIDSLFIGPYVNLGFIYSDMDSLDLSIRYFNKGLTIEPDNAVVFNNRGFAFYKMHEYAKAMSDINKSISLYPTNSYAYRNLALVYIATDKLYEACKALNYASEYGFTSRYGTEVDELMDKYCKK